MTDEIRTTVVRTEMLRVDANVPDPDAIARASLVLRRGGLVAFPTETVYGLGANALDAAAVESIYTAKGRPANNPLIVHVAYVADAQRLVTDWPERAELLAARFWPGPLTLVLPRRPDVPDNVTAGGATIGIRAPSHPVARALLLAANLPIAAPSANRSTEISPTRASHVFTSLNGRVELILDGGPTSGGLESTVLDLTTRRPTLLRPGLISPSELEAVVGPIKRHHGEVLSSFDVLPAPGMAARHYAPRALLEISSDGARRAQALVEQGERVGWLTLLPALFRETFMAASDEVRLNVIMIAMPRDAAAYAADLYSSLHALDAAGVTRIVVDRPPELESWLAVRDRLRRASTPAAQTE